MPPRKPIADLIEELQSWLPNYDHGPEDYPTLLWRILASAPGGDRAEDMGYEPFQLGWQEIDQLGRVLVAIEDKRDVEDLIEGLLGEEGEEVEERRHSRRPLAPRRPPPMPREAVRQPASPPVRPPMREAARRPAPPPRHAPPMRPAAPARGPRRAPPPPPRHRRGR